MDNRAEMHKHGHAGSYCFEQRAEPDQSELIYLCPCGCGVVGRLLVGRGSKPSGPRSNWLLSGPANSPTLEPSVNQVGHWHGWLRNGYWEHF